MEIEDITRLLVREGALVVHKGQLVEPHTIPQPKPVVKQKFSEAKPSILVWLFAFVGAMAACSEGTKTGNIGSFLMVFPNICAGMVMGAFYSFLLNLFFRRQIVFPLAFEFMFLRKHAPRLFSKMQSASQSNPQLKGRLASLTQQVSKIATGSSWKLGSRIFPIALFSASAVLMLIWGALQGGETTLGAIGGTFGGLVIGLGIGLVIAGLAFISLWLLRKIHGPIRIVALGVYSLFLVFFLYIGIFASKTNIDALLGVVVGALVGEMFGVVCTLGLWGIGSLIRKASSSAQNP